VKNRVAITGSRSNRLTSRESRSPDRRERESDAPMSVAFLHPRWGNLHLVSSRPLTIDTHPGIGRLPPKNVSGQSSVSCDIFTPPVIIIFPGDLKSAAAARQTCNNGRAITDRLSQYFLPYLLEYVMRYRCTLRSSNGVRSFKRQIMSIQISTR